MSGLLECGKGGARGGKGCMQASIFLNEAVEPKPQPRLARKQNTDGILHSYLVILMPVL